MVPVYQNAGPAAGRPDRARRPRVPAGTRVYAVGDIHGRSDLLWRLHRMIAADAANTEGLRKVVVYIGDYVDRGPDSQGVIEMLIEKPLDGFESLHLKGNHEDFMLRFMDSGAYGDSWMMNGGAATLESYGIDVYELAGDGLAEARRALLSHMPETHRRFLDGLRLSHREGDYLFVHAGVRPGVALDAQSAQDLMWIRDEFLDSDADHGAVVVHGHTVRETPTIRPNRIGIDTGAFRSGRLTALALEADDRRFLST